MGVWAYTCVGVYGCMGMVYEWVYGCACVWVYRRMGVWVYVCMGVWVYGCTCVGVYGCMGVRVNRLTKPLNLAKPPNS